ncbi:MAG: hypothetical protein DMG46_17220, partial [Acidobacteria bacterium]
IRTEGTRATVIRRRPLHCGTERNRPEEFLGRNKQGLGLEFQLAPRTGKLRKVNDAFEVTYDLV